MTILCAGCFTGVESTPKITGKEVKRQNVVDTPEKHVLDSLKIPAPVNWITGKRFYIADNRAARAAWSIEPFLNSDSISGRTAILEEATTVPTLTDKEEVQLTFSVPDIETTIVYRTGLTLEAWNNADSYNLPHIIDLDLIDKVREILINRTFYILPARRIGHNNIDTIGTRYQPVTILDVQPYSESSPFRLIFKDDEGHVSSILMTYGDLTTSRRNFETLFTIENPRQKYKHITDTNWELIRHGRIARGMTPEECRLALGPPDNYYRIPTTAGMVERWTYTNGVYLVFEEGLLASFRQ